nr:uncharacterized protein LOC127335929 [Lolium perenne]
MAAPRWSSPAPRTAPLPTRAAARSCCRRPRSRAPAAGLNSVLLMPTISSSSCCRISSCYGVRELSLSAPNYLTEVAELKCSILAETLDGEGDVSDRLVGKSCTLSGQGAPYSALSTAVIVKGHVPVLMPLLCT